MYRKSRRYVFRFSFTMLLLASVVLGVCASILPKSAEAADITTGLVGYWTFDEGSGTNAADSSGNGNDATLSWDTWTTGYLSNAFDGSDDFACVDHSTEYLNDNTTTWSVRFKVTIPLSDYKYPMSKGENNSGIGFYYFGGDFITFARINGSWYGAVIASEAAVDDGEWHMFSFTYDGTSLVSYLDGVAVDTTNAPGGIDHSTTHLCFSAWQQGQFYSGFHIDEGRIYNRTLTPADIAALYAYPEVSNGRIIRLKGVRLRGMRLGGTRSIANAVNESISSNQTNLSLYSLAGSPATAGNYVFTIQTGVVVYATATNVPALDASGFPSGTTISIINNGSIIGKGGAGGAGGAAFRNFGVNSVNNGTAGGAGGDAIKLGTNNVTIDNTSGNIFGGGGGGGGGGGAINNFDDGESFNLGVAGGSGGGAGRSYSASSGASGGAATANVSPLTQTNGNSGNNSSDSSAGTGGGTATATYLTTNAFGGAGGNGGDYGAAGSVGSSGSGSGATSNSAYGTGGSGGAAGNAISLNGQTVTWLGGNNGTQVKGAVQ